MGSVQTLGPPPPQKKNTPKDTLRLSLQNKILLFPALRGKNSGTVPGPLTISISILPSPFVNMNHHHNDQHDFSYCSS